MITLDLMFGVSLSMMTTESLMDNTTQLYYASESINLSEINVRNNKPKVCYFLILNAKDI